MLFRSPYLGGIFYWTGFDYRGEPNPLKYPATGSQYGIFDYCGFPKDEAFYLKSWWTEKPVLHLFPHWNLQGHEGKNVDVWAYSNCDEIELFVNGKSMGCKQMIKNGFLSWNVVYHPGILKAIGYKNGKKQLIEKIETTGEPFRIALTADRNRIKSDNRDVSVVRVELWDKKGRIVPTACNELELSIEGAVRFLGVGNGDPAYRVAERPLNSGVRTFKMNAFNGLAQILLQSTGEAGAAKLIIKSHGLQSAIYELELENKVVP